MHDEPNTQKTEEFVWSGVRFANVDEAIDFLRELDDETRASLEDRIVEIERVNIGAGS